MYDYYIGNTDVLRNYPTTDRSNRKIVDNFIKAFIDEEVSFMTGVPVTYSAKDGNNNIIDDIEYNLNNVSYNIDTELATNLLIFGEAYELYYINEDEFKIKIYDKLLKHECRYAIQGEVYGPKIQKNNLQSDEVKIAIFCIKDIINNKYLGMQEMIDVCKELDLPMVEIIEKGDSFDYTLEQLLEKSKGKYPGTEQNREGLVYRLQEN